MTLYHCSLNYGNLVKEFTPRVPDCLTTDSKEDRVVPRICLAPTVRQCISAISNGDLYKGYPLTVYTARFDDRYIVEPEKLHHDYNVIDALYTREHWYVKPIIMYGTHYTIQQLEYDSYAIPDYDRLPRAIRVAKLLFSDNHPEIIDLLEDGNMHDAFETINKYCSDLNMYAEDFADEYGGRSVRVICNLTVKNVK